MSDIVDRPMIGPQLPICNGAITLNELDVAVRRLKLGKTAVQIPAEFLKAFLQADALDEECWLLKLMRLCWDTKTIPTAWHVSKVIPVYKKGDPSECDNYRPI